MRYGKMPAPRGGQRHKKGRSFTAPSLLLYDNQYIIVPSKKSMPSVSATPTGVTWEASGSRGAPPSAAKQPAATHYGCRADPTRQVCHGRHPEAGELPLQRQSNRSPSVPAVGPSRPGGCDVAGIRKPKRCPFNGKATGRHPSRLSGRPDTSGGSSCVLWSGGWRKRGGRLPHGRWNPGSPPRCAGFAQCCLPLCRQ